MAGLAQTVANDAYNDYLRWHRTREDVIPDMYFAPPLPATTSISTLHKELNCIENEVNDYRRRWGQIRADIFRALELLERRAANLARQLRSKMPSSDAGMHAHEMFLIELARRRNAWDRRRSRRLVRARQLFVSVSAAPETVSRVIQTPEIALNILLFLPPAERVGIFRVCRAWRDLAWSQARRLFPRAVLGPGAPPPYVLARWSDRRVLCMSCSCRLRAPRRFVCGVCHSRVRGTCETVRA